MVLALMLDRGASRSERAAARAKIGRLRDARIAKRTLGRYTTAVAWFEAWRKAAGLRQAQGLAELDAQLADFIETLWEEGEPKGLAADALCGAQHFLESRRCFPVAWGLYRTWDRVELPARAPPLTAEMVMAVANVFRMRGRVELAAAVLLGFHCALRTSELMAAQPRHILFTAANVGVLALPLTKSGQRRGAQEQVSIDDPLVGLWLQRSFRQRRGTIAGCSGPSFRKQFGSALRALSLQAFGFQPYSLRRGGATHDFLHHQSIQRTLLRGRWSDIRTAQIYITEGAALVAQQRLSPQAAEAVRSHSAAFITASHGTRKARSGRQSQ